MAASALLAAALLAAGAPAAAIQLDKQDWLVPGTFEQGRQPDGNSIVLIGPKGAIVFDTGRHVAQSDKIEAMLAGQDKPLVAIVNSHWHLDHVSGNPRLKATHPGAQVWASGAIDGALTGFLRSSARDGQAALDSGQLPASIAQDVRGDLATVAAGEQLRPDHVVTRSGPVTIAGRRLQLNLASHAATEGDVWLYDAPHKRAIVGDLVTLPAPFLDTACPDGWAKALAEVARTPFETLVPGHGPVMDRAAFAAWRTAFGAFLDCAQDGARPLAACTAGWLAYAGPGIAKGEEGRARGLVGYYADLVRSGGLKKYCAEAGSPA